jgi:Ni/Fe-hydrogenase 1 B-type cytochrome subunit
MGFYQDKRSVNLRVWHWLSALAMFGLIATFILRKTFLNYKENAVIIQNKLAEVGVIIADDKAKEIAKILRDNMWQWHYYIGFVFAALLAYRLFAFITHKDNFPTCKAKKSGSMEFKAVKYAHVAFYAVAIYEAMSGLVMYFHEALGLQKESLHTIKELHEAAFWFFALFVVAHIVGVIKAEITTDKGLISEMFNGGDEK